MRTRTRCPRRAESDAARQRRGGDLLHVASLGDDAWHTEASCPILSLGRLIQSPETGEHMYGKKVLLSFFATFVVLMAGSRDASAGSCSVRCQKGSCSADGGRRPAFCYCKPNGRPRCGVGEAPVTSEPPEDIVSLANEEDLGDLESHILRAYDLGLFDVGDAASTMYDSIVGEDEEIYHHALLEHSNAIAALPDALREQLYEPVE